MDEFTFLNPLTTYTLRADSLLLAIGAEGTFLTREKAHGKEDEVVLSVIFTGKATHHLVNRDSETGTMMINGRETPAKTLGELQTLLRKKQPYWPAPLTTGVEGPDEVGQGELVAVMAFTFPRPSTPEIAEGGAG